MCINGSYSNVRRSLLNELQNSVKDDNHISKNELENIKNIAESEGIVLNDNEKDLLSKLDIATKESKFIQTFNLPDSGFDAKNSQLSFNLKIDSSRMVVSLEDGTGIKGNPGFQGVVNPLPNLEHTGAVMLEVNNPEKVSSEGLLFSTRNGHIDKDLKLGEGNNKEFNYYSYSDVKPMRDKGYKDKTIYQAVVVTNPGPEDMEIEIKGSGYTNSEIKPNSLDSTGKPNPKDPKNKEYFEYMDLQKQKLLTVNGKPENTRIADYKLAEDLTKEDYKIPSQKKKIKKGESMIVYTKIEPKENTLRAGYSFKVTSPKNGQKVDIDTMITTQDFDKKNQNINKSKSDRCGFTVMKLQPKDMKSNFVETVEIEKGRKVEHLRTGENIKEITKNNGLRDNRGRTGTDIREPVRDMDNIKGISVNDIKVYTKKRPEKPKNQDNEKDKEPYHGVSIGRNNCIKEHSEVTSKIPDIKIDNNDLDLNYAVNTKILDTVGSGQDQSTNVSATTLYGENKIRANNEDIAHGNYNTKYSISTVLKNTTDKPKDIMISLGSPDQISVENGNYQKPSYEDEEFSGNLGARFTGIMKLSVGNNIYYADILHGKTQTPEKLNFRPDPKNKANDITIENGLIKLPPGVSSNIKIDFVIPTNSTGPEVLTIRSNK